MSDDLSLLERVRAGDREAAGTLFERHFDAIYRYCRSFPDVDHDEAMDVAQAAMIRSFEAAEALRDAEAFRPWAFSIARNIRGASRRREASRRMACSAAIRRLRSRQASKQAHVASAIETAIATVQPSRCETIAPPMEVIGPSGWSLRKT